MADSLTGIQVIDQVIDDIPDNRLGYKFTGTATASGVIATTTDPRLGKGGADALTEKFLNWYLWIPEETGADQTHLILSHATVESTGVTTFTTLGPNYGSTTTDKTMYVLAIHPDQLIALINDALERVFTDYRVGIGTGPDDSHFQDDNTTSWAATSNVTVTKTTTASEVLSGVRAGDFAFSAAGYSQSTLVNVGTSRNVMMWGIMKADVGTGTMRLVDASDNTLTGVDFTQEIWLLILKQYTNDTTDEAMRIQIRGAANLDVVHVQEAHIVREGKSLFKAPSWLDERFKQIGLSQVELNTSGTETDTYEAEMLTYHRLEEGDDYQYVNRRGDVNPHQFQLLKSGLTNRPLFIEAKLPYSYFGTMTVAGIETDTTTAPLHVLAARCVILLSEKFQAFDSINTAKFERLAAELEQVRHTRPAEPEIKSQRMFR